ncbi:hypothetical protein H9Q13_07335 [Pontibacter sp. JH31]|uniref:Uncharacterized protein n=1 Tax=Pontibacter aquaedesilientis TaxID=2766980 RepID=A0ABR7XH82_9BACT|nr:hypothetical protein [Pontibacter aquaedesilientis]MBD1396973.1 hypothetical protein [Pontibacter aquaedesilientis]
MKKLDTNSRFLLVLVVLLGWPLLTYGQFRDSFETQEWHFGKVVLATGVSLSGQVVYHPAKEVVQVSSDDGAISSFSPVNVSYFVVNDIYTGKPQLFRSIFWNLGKQDTDFKKPVFFEQLNDGRLVLIKRQTGVVAKPTDNQIRDPYQEALYPHTRGTSESIQEAYYALLPNGEIVPLRKKKRDLLQLFGEKSDQVKQFAKSNKLDYNNPNQLVTIVNYFNSL